MKSNALIEIIVVIICIAIVEATGINLSFIGRFIVGILGVSLFRAFINEK